jgi:ABC-type branched-subunit amino acid transport system substrate-binding protein
VTPFLQFRLWLRDGPRAQHVGVVLLVVAVIGLLIASIAADDDGDVVASGPGGTFVVLPDGSAGGPVAGPSTDGLGGPGATVPAVTGGSGGAVPGAGGDTAGGTDTGATPGAGAATGPRTASDRGVTADEIKIGFLIVNPGGLDDGGFALGLRTDVDKIVDAFVADVNGRGGINGRKLVAVKRKTDPTNQEDQVAACAAMTKDQQVFAVFHTAALIFANTQKCFTQDNAMPLFGTYPLSADFQAAGNGLDVSITKNLDRVAGDWGAAARELGFLKAGQRVGIFTDKCEPSNRVLKTRLVPEIQQANVASITFAEVACDPAAQQTEVPNAVLKLKSAGVTHAFLATAYVGVQNFLQSAELQDFRPKYFTSEYDGLDNDLFLKNFPEEQWDRVQGITSGYGGSRAAGHQPPPEIGKCSAMVEKAGLPPLDDRPASSEGVALCDELTNVFVPAATKAGVNLTRATLAAAIQSMGRFPSAISPDSSFGPGKFSARDSISTIEWRRECKCVVRISEFRKGKY